MKSIRIQYFNLISAESDQEMSEYMYKVIGINDNSNKKSMVEVFKTDVNEHEHAKLLVDQIHKTFIGYKANFDLDDCDKILRIESSSQVVDVSTVIDLLNDFGFYADVLEDEVPSGGHFSFERELSKKD